MDVNDEFTIEQFVRYLYKIKNKVYVYILRDNNKIPFYVGKGVKGRALEHFVNISSHKYTNKSKQNEVINILEGYQPIYIYIDSVWDTDDDARDRENALILQYGRRCVLDGLLTNKLVNDFRGGKTIYNLEYVKTLCETRNKITGDDYDYGLITENDIKKGKSAKIPIVCRKHGVFYQRLNNHIFLRHKCPFCVGGVKLQNPKKHYTPYIKEFEIKNDVVVLDDLSCFYKKKLHINGIKYICKKCFKISSISIAHLRETDRGCPYCNGGGNLPTKNNTYLQTLPLSHYFYMSKIRWGDSWDYYLNFAVSYRGDDGLIYAQCKVCKRFVPLTISRGGFLCRGRADKPCTCSNPCSRLMNKRKYTKPTKIAFNEPQWEMKEININELIHKYANGYEVEIYSQDGWVRVNEVIDRGVKDCVNVGVYSTNLVCSKDHLVNIYNSAPSGNLYKESQSLKQGDLVITMCGVEPVKYIKDAGSHQVYDLAVESSNHRYFAGGISSHNCAGSGKTSSLKILANAIICDNQQDGSPCLECQSCKEFLEGIYTDIIELDAGQFNKVDDIAKLIEIAKIYPIHSHKQRIIILDEAHRLSNAAWDSMLKLLEDGNIRTIFMFATTEGEKIRPAIHSRSISLKTKPLSVTEIQKELIRVCQLEGIEYDAMSIQSIAYANNGRMRDALKTLDMYNRSQGNLNNIIIKTDNERFCEILKLTHLHKTNEAIEILDTMMSRAGLGNVLCDTISAIYSYPNNIIGGIPEIVLQNTKKLLTKHIRKIVELYMQYKPNTYEQIKLFLLIMGENDKKSSKNMVESAQQKRQLFKSARKEVKTEDDDEL